MLPTKTLSKIPREKLLQVIQNSLNNMLLLVDLTKLDVLINAHVIRPHSCTTFYSGYGKQIEKIAGFMITKENMIPLEI